MKWIVSNRQITISLLVLYPLCILIGVVGFYQMWGAWPQMMDVFMGTTLLAPFAFPKSFSDLVGLTAMNSTRGMLLSMAGYWGVMLPLLWFSAKRNSGLLLCLFVGGCIAASVRWFVVSTGMMGI